MGALALRGLGPPHGSHISPERTSPVASMWQCDIDPVAVGVQPGHAATSCRPQVHQTGPESGVAAGTSSERKVQMSVFRVAVHPDDARSPR